MPLPCPAYPLPGLWDAIHSRMNEKTLAILEKLIAICKDGAEGFEIAANEVRSSELQSLFQGYSLQRLRRAGELETAASALGRSVSTEPDSVSKAGRTWMAPAETGTVRDEHAVLSECERGEEAAVAAYTLALEEAELPPAVRATIATQAGEVKDAHKEIHGRRNRFAPAAGA